MVTRIVIQQSKRTII